MSDKHDKSDVSHMYDMSDKSKKPDKADVRDGCRATNVCFCWSERWFGDDGLA